MTTSAYRQSDYNTNIDQTDRHLHVTSGSETLKTEEQSLINNDIKELLQLLLIEQKITNAHLSEMTGNIIDEKEIR